MVNKSHNMAKDKYDPTRKFKVNFQIKADYVSLIDEENHMLGQMSKNRAIDIAHEKNLDLVEINSNSYPPIVKVCDYNKFLYDQKKKAKLQRKNVQKLHTIQIHLGTDENDRNHKFKQIRKFLSEGDLVKFAIVLLGKEVDFKKKQAFEFMDECLAQFSDVAQFDNPPKAVGKNIEVLLKKRSEKFRQ